MHVRSLPHAPLCPTCAEAVFSRRTLRQMRELALSTKETVYEMNARNFRPFHAVCYIIAHTMHQCINVSDMLTSNQHFWKHGLTSFMSTTV